MTRVPSTFNTAPPERSFNNTDAINDLELGTFLKLMIAELQNQDPLNPLDNKDMLAQISQIREVGATDKLTKTLESVLLGQNIASATNLIGADITALSDDAESVEGIVDRVSIDKGEPKLHIELSTKAEPSTAEGNLEKGTYAYRIVWERADGSLHGIDLSGAAAVTTTGTAGKDQAVVLRNLPKNTGPKQIYRARVETTGTGPYQLVGVLNNGDHGTFLDTLSDEQRSETRLTRPFSRSSATNRAYQVSLKNVSGIRPPETILPNDPADDVEVQRPIYSPQSRSSF